MLGRLWYEQMFPPFTVAPDASVPFTMPETAPTNMLTSNTHGNAQKKASDLLHDWLTPSQRRCFYEHGYFVVAGGSTGTLYRVNSGCVFNVDQLDCLTGLVIRKLCFIPDQTSFAGDVMLAQKIMLETHEERALQIANKQPTRGISFES